MLCVLGVVNEHGTGQPQQRYMLPNETFGSLFGAGLDLKNDLATPHGVYMNSTPTTLQPQNLPLLPPTQHQLLPPTAAINQCNINSSTTPTIYTIEDHGGGPNALINLANPQSQSQSNGVVHKKRKLSSPETAASPSSSSSSTSPASSANKSMNVKQEPRESITYWNNRWIEWLKK